MKHERRFENSGWPGLAILGLLIASSGGLLATEPPASSSAPDAILHALDTYRIVAIGETHGHGQFHELLLEVLRDPRVQARVDDIVVEFGNSRYQPLLDRYIAGCSPPDKNIRRVWRDTITSPGTVWDSPVYEEFFAGVRKINAGLVEERRYRVLAADVPIDWESVTSAEDLRPFGDRSRQMFDVLRKEVLRNSRRAIFVAGGAHVSRVNMVRTAKSGLEWAEVTPISLLNLYYPGSVYAIRSMGRAGPGYHLDTIAGVPTGAVVEINGLPLGDVGANEITTMRNYDGPPFTLYGDAHFADLVDAIIYWGADDEFEAREPDPAIYRDEAWWKELNRRSMAVRGKPLPEEMRGQAE